MRKHVSAYGPETGLRLLAYLSHSLKDDERAIFRLFWPDVLEECGYDIIEATGLLYSTNIPESLSPSQRDSDRRKRRRARKYVENLASRNLEEKLSATYTLSDLLSTVADPSLN